MKLQSDVESLSQVKLNQFQVLPAFQYKLSIL